MNDYVLNMALEEGYKFGKKLIKIEGKKKTIEVAKKLHKVSRAGFSNSFLDILIDLLLSTGTSLPREVSSDLHKEYHEFEETAKAFVLGMNNAINEKEYE